MNRATSGGGTSRRSTFLIIAAIAVNVYLVGYGADAALSTVDALLNGATGYEGLANARQFLADSVFLASFAIVLLLIFVPQLPRRILLPPVLFLIWVDLGAFPLLRLGADEAMELVLPLGQLAVFAAVVVALSRRTGTWYLTAATLPRKQHLIRHTLIALAATLVLSPFVLAGLGIVAVVSALEQQTHDYLRFDLTGIDVKERVFTKGNKTVHLIGMVHIGDPAFYRAVSDGFTPGALVLTEGVTDRQGLLTAKLSYSHVAQAIGLGQQPPFQELAAARKDQATADSGTAKEPPKTPPDIVDADVDMSDLSKTTVNFIDWIGTVYASGSLREAVARLMVEPQPFSAADVAMVLDDIIKTRNAKVLSTFDMDIAGHDTVFIPWGAEHMPGVEEGLRQRGFAFQSERRLRVAGYGTIAAKLAQL
jgi:hypothetical protein